jgi:hydroxyethylthiazole kinase
MSIPITFDLAGSDVSRYRIKTVHMMLTNHQISIVSGYDHEIICLLAGGLVNQSTQQPIDERRLIENAKLLSEKHNVTTAISGKKHIIINYNNMKQFNFDSELVQNVAGISNLLAGIISTFSAIEKDPFIATMNAVHFYAGCVGPSSSEASGPASLITKIIDYLYINAAKAQPMTL